MSVAADVLLMLHLQAHQFEDNWGDLILGSGLLRAIESDRGLYIAEARPLSRPVPRRSAKDEEVSLPSVIRVLLSVPTCLLPGLRAGVQGTLQEPPCVARREASA